MSKEYCLYIHTCPNGKVYIGITSKRPKDRWAGGCGYKTQLFGKAIKKYGWENIKHEVLYENLTKEEARVLEIWMIDKYNSKNPKYGYNQTIGGDGACGHFVTDAQRKKLSEHALKVWSNPQTREHLVAHLREISKKNIGRKMSPSAIQKTTEALSIKVDQYTKDGQFVQTHNSLMKAAKSVGKDSNSAIVACCKGKRKSYLGFIWKYNGEPLTSEHLAWANFHDYYNKKAITAYDLDGNLIETFESIHDAGRKYGISYKSIHHACNSKSHILQGYIWKYS